MKVFEICKNPVIAISAKATLQQAAILMNAKSVGCLVVVDASEIPIGIVTDRDIVVKGMIKGGSSDCDSVECAMSEKVRTISEDKDLLELPRAFQEAGVRRLIVTNHFDGRVCGLISADDILEILVRQIGALADVYRVTESGHFNQDFTQMI